MTRPPRRPSPRAWAAGLTPAAAGILMKLGGVFAFAVMNVMIKALAEVPPGQVVFFRAFFALLPLALVASLAAGGLVRMVRTDRPWLHVRRALTGTLAMTCFFISIMTLPLVEATAITFVMPIFAVVLAPVMLAERVGPWRWGAVLTGFAGVLLAIAPQIGTEAPPAGGPLSGNLALGAAIGLVGAFLAALVVVFIRQMSATETSESIVFYFMATASVLSGLTLFFDAVWPSPAEWAMLIACGLVGGCGQLLMTYSYRFAEPSLLAPFDYTSIAWAVVFGLIFFAEIPTLFAILGVLLVIVSGVVIAWRERVRRVDVVTGEKPDVM